MNYCVGRAIYPVPYFMLYYFFSIIFKIPVLFTIFFVLSVLGICIEKCPVK